MSTNEQDYTPKKRLGIFHSCLICGLLGFICVVTVGYLFVFRSVPLEVSEETTYITEPLKSDGRQVDYFRAWELAVYPENMATEDNGYRLIVEHLGPSPESRGNFEHFAQVCEKLGLVAVAVKPDMTFEEPYTFLQNYVASEEFDQALVDRLSGKEPSDEEAASEETEDAVAEETEVEIGEDEEFYDEEEYSSMEYEREPIEVLEEQLGGPWTLDDLPMMDKWLEENGPALDMIGEAVRKPTFCIPLARTGENEPLIATLLPDIHWMRSFARGLQARALYRIGAGDIDGAIDDIITCKRLGRHVGHGSTLVQMLVGLALEGIANGTGIAGSLEHPPTKEQLQRLMDELNDLPPRVRFEEVMELERFGTLDVIQAIACHEDGAQLLSDLSDIPVGAITVIGVDWNIVMKRTNENFDNMLATGEYTRMARFHPAVLVDIRARSEWMAGCLCDLLLPATMAAKEACRRLKCTDNLQRITLAMLLYEADHGTLPPAYTVDKEGNALHSWRVALLPYLGEQELYDKLRLNEPFSSEHNAQFHDEAVDFYRCPSHDTAGPGESTYSVVVGPDMPFEDGEGKALADFGPHSADMILVVERNAPICWMDPTSDIPQAEAENGILNDDFGKITRSADSIGSRHPGGANFGQRNGAVQFLSETINQNTFKSLLNGTNETTDY